MLVILWMVIRFCFSDIDNFLSNNKSKNIMANFIQSNVNAIDKLGIADKQLNVKKKREVTHKLNLPLRKIVHISIYLIIALLLINTLIISKCEFQLYIIFSVLVSFIFAISDDYHQSFVDGVNGKIIGALIDTVGDISRCWRLYCRIYWL